MSDVDLWIGGLFESLPNEDQGNNRLNSGVLGETFTCLFAKQFLDLKRGDRHFYENAPNINRGTNSTAFTMKQLNEIKKQSLAALTCRNLNISKIQPKVFFKHTIDSLSPNHSIGAK